MKKVSKVIIGILWIVTIVLSFYLGMYVLRFRYVANEAKIYL